MNINVYKYYIGIIIKHLKKKYTNLSAEEAFKIASDIVDEFASIENNQT